MSWDGEQPDVCGAPALWGGVEALVDELVCELPQPASANASSAAAPAIRPCIVHIVGGLRGAGASLRPAAG